MTIKIPLRNGDFAIVDDCDSHLSNWKWRFSTKGYAVRGFTGRDGSKGTIWMHHAICGYPFHGKMVDHINNDKLNNCRDNLRFVTNRQNMSNQQRKKSGRTTSKFVGVHFSKNSNKWISQILIDGQRKYLGSFNNEEIAAFSYQLAMGKS